MQALYEAVIEYKTKIKTSPGSINSRTTEKNIQSKQDLKNRRALVSDQVVRRAICNLRHAGNFPSKSDILFYNLRLNADLKDTINHLNEPIRICNDY